MFKFISQPVNQAIATLLFIFVLFVQSTTAQAAAFEPKDISLEEYKAQVTMSSAQSKEELKLAREENAAKKAAAKAAWMKKRDAEYAAFLAKREETLKNSEK